MHFQKHGRTLSVFKQQHTSRCCSYFVSILFFFFILLWVYQRPHQRIHIPQVMTIIVLVCCVMNCMVPCSHDRIHPHMKTIVNICRPNRRCKQQQLMRQEMHGNKEECPGIRNSLKNTIQRMKRQSSKRRQRMLLVINVVNMMQVFISWANIMQQPMLPVDKKLNTGHVQCKVQEILSHTHIIYPRITHRPALLYNIFRTCRKQRIQRHCHKCHLHLFNHCLH